MSEPGPLYCGTGCLANCDATAECGKFAKEPGKKCPLNVCCSQHGFCGTTTDFCNSKCQSNCVEHPKPPGGSSTGRTLSRVIGYYEAWNARSKCHETLPKDLPLAALTHINYAFAFIHPVSFVVTTMDSATPGSLFADLERLKSAKPSLQIWVSIGGWTFSDDNTPTQPVFGNIARDQKYREIFAKNLLSFVQMYGYDGVDIDWEYPGAPDRGGKPEDVENYVLLLKEIRAVFDRSGRQLGISLTIPASYWYLKWFDLPGLLKYADFVNLMSYDLHGVWDSSNPIGSRVLGHTNLTEISLAAELLWRAGVKPSQVSLGFGFYGRAFTLQDPSCTTPGCPFKEGARPGVCTGTSGYLAYYEVQDILKKNPDIEVVHDKEAAVKYMTWDQDQWISFDDADTFKQKVEWADKIGFSGALIWASDLDDYTWSAHKALISKEIPNNYKIPNPLVRRMLPGTTYEEYSTEACYRQKDCADLNNPLVSRCASGYFTAGYDVSDCGDNKKIKYAKRICCPSSNSPTYCTWRGRPDWIGDCNGQCQQGEMTLFESRRGGKSELGNKDDESGENKKCRRGVKTFCCGSRRFSKEDRTCRWTQCNEKCSGDESELAKVVQYDDKDKGSKGCNWYKDGQRYCCKKGYKDVTAFKYCNWVGQGDCGENRCSGTEVTVHQSSVGAGGWKQCLWGRKKSLCCSPNPDFDMQHSATMCAAGVGESLLEDELPDYEDDGADDSLLDRAAGPSDLTLHPSVRSLEARGGRRTYMFDVVKWLPSLVTHLGKELRFSSSPYPQPPRLVELWAKSEIPAIAFRMAAGSCVQPGLEKLDPSKLTTPAELRLFPHMDIEHSIDLNVLSNFFQTAMTGILPSQAIVATKVGFTAVQLWSAWKTPMTGPLPPLKLPRGSEHTINDHEYVKAASGVLDALHTEAGVAEKVWGLTGFQELFQEFQADFLKHSTSTVLRNYEGIVKTATQLVTNKKYGLPADIATLRALELEKLGKATASMTLKHLIRKDSGS
ncbi:symbiotic chitinase [Cordyceps fumosorosea ARSEF 2679]|uniref:chitinase n=1 Tax=Cordyceps fumosorosea (strain ARSEF 2679) TaxID=1081104 RepID=A0A167ZL42_CORFA|nr:symbiotic chitinase [Cordyceps fumosorosea ARSEF 2679]OAA67644.1 symbiotic chitinase [Cordyceps fumosorosea ARSEF 2679]